MSSTPPAVQPVPPPSPGLPPTLRPRHAQAAPHLQAASQTAAPPSAPTSPTSRSGSRDGDGDGHGDGTAPPAAYDPLLDPSHSLRVVHSYAESLADADQSERRHVASMRRRRQRGTLLFRKIASSLRAGPTHPQHHHHRVSFHDPDFPPLQDLDDEARASEQPLVPPSPPPLDTLPEPQPKGQRRPPDASPGPPAWKRFFQHQQKPLVRRRVYMNIPLPSPDLDKNGQPKVLYARNKVRTTKYTLWSFLPKFLFEQFRRIANIFFLILIFLQMRVEFTAGNSIPQVAMLPLVFILAITAAKDGVEDYRRHVLDNSVNNAPAVCLGQGWTNVNKPCDARGPFRRLFGLSGPRSSVKPTRGIRKLRSAHADDDIIAMERLTFKHKLDRPDEASARGVYTGGYDSLDGYDDAHASFAELPTEDNLYSEGRASTESTTLRSSRAEVVDESRPAGAAAWERTMWKKVEVGDVLLLHEDDPVPADMVILATSDHEGQAYVETKNLDGETNLKPRQALKATQRIRCESDLERATFVIDAEAPQPNLYSFNGVLEFTPSGGSISDGFALNETDATGIGCSLKIEPVTINELALRGSTLRNTRWAVGLVLFTGDDTKIMLNSGETPSKRSKIEKETNFNVGFNFVLLFAMCLVCAIVGGINSGRTNDSRAFYERNSLYGSSPVANGAILFAATIIVFQNIVPISLYISIEIVKTIQAFFIHRDLEMYYEPLDYPCVPKSWNIADDLGQIEYIFSDKTGTLTQNVMEFKKCSIAGTAYGSGMTEASIGALRREGKNVTQLELEELETQLQQEKQAMLAALESAAPNAYLRPGDLTVVSLPLAEVLSGHTDSPDYAERQEQAVCFFRALALCHTALVARLDDDKVHYKAESPDEEALVSAARDLGFVFLKRSHQELQVQVLGQQETYEPLHVLAFNSTRKRMSVILREPGSGRILLLAKGADSVIFERLALDHDPHLMERTSKDLETFAKAGLRTLCVAYKYIDSDTYAQWAEGHAAAAASFVDREDRVDESSALIEQGLYLLGATALEDKLQQGVPDAIAQLRRAGIKVWILTGDKLQTAIEIGFSCNLLSTDMDIFIISSDTATEAEAQINAAADKVAAAGRPILVGGQSRTLPSNTASLPSAPPRDGFAVVIDGETLKWALSKEHKPLFLALSTQCEAVVCCRVSPAQKAQVVRLVKDGCGSMTLAIGDGANDVAMIQEAHCGVGIAGKEGAQAAMSADYAVGQFRFLVRLLLVHGHWSVVRMARMHCVFFFKNIIWTLCLAWFQLMVEFDGTYLVPYPFILLFNLVFTSLPSVVLGALDQDVNAAALVAVPETYFKGRQGQYYTRPIFFGYVLDGIYQSAVCFFLPWAMWGQRPATNADGHDMMSLYIFGTSVAGAAVTCANLAAAAISSYWTWLFWVIEMLSILAFFIFSAIYSAFDSFIFDDVAYWLYASVLFWATLAITVVAALLPRFCFLAWRASFFPDDCTIVREQWVVGNLKDRLHVPHKRPKRAEKRRQKKARKQKEASGLAPDMEAQHSSMLPSGLGSRFGLSQESLRASFGYHAEGSSRGDEDDDIWARSVSEYQVGETGGQAKKNDVRDKDGPLQSQSLLHLDKSNSRTGNSTRLVDLPPNTQLAESQVDAASSFQSSYDPYPSSNPILPPPGGPKREDSGKFVGAQRATSLLAPLSASASTSSPRTCGPVARQDDAFSGTLSSTNYSLSSNPPPPVAFDRAAYDTETGLLGGTLGEMGYMGPLSSLAPTLSSSEATASRLVSLAGSDSNPSNPSSLANPRPSINHPHQPRGTSQDSL